MASHPPPFPFFFFLLLLLLFLLHLSHPTAALSDPPRPRALHVGLHASWPHTSPSAAILPWLSRTFSSTLPLAFLQTLSEHRAAAPANLTDAHQHALVLAALNAHLPAHLPAAVAQLVLASHINSPHLQLHYTLFSATSRQFARQRRAALVAPLALVTDASRMQAYLLESPVDDFDCASCPSISARHPLPLLQPLTTEVVLNPLCNAHIHVLLYLDPLHPDVAAWMPSVQRAVRTCAAVLYLRFAPPHHPSVYSPSLQAFTVTATLKSTEYKVLDDTVYKTALFADCAYGSDKCMGASPAAAANLTYQWPPRFEKKTYTAVQAVQFVYHQAVDFAHLLQRLRLFAEDTPSVTRSPAFLDANYAANDAHQRALMRRLRTFRKLVSPANALYINRYPFHYLSITQSMDKFVKCTSTIAAVNRNLHVLDATATQHLMAGGGGTHLNQNGLRVNLDFHNLLPTSLVWLNNITSDSRYKRWPSLDPYDEQSVQAFLRSVQNHMSMSVTDGMAHLRLVKMKSHHLNLVLVVDPGDETQFGYLGIPESVIKADLPIQVGVVLVPNGDVSTVIAACFHYFLRLKGRKTAITFVGMIRQVMQYLAGAYQQVPLNMQIVEMAFAQIVGEVGGEYTSAAQVMTDEGVKAILQEAQRFAHQQNMYEIVEAEEHDKEAQASQKVSLLCWLNGIIVKDVSSDVIDLALAEQARIADLLKYGPLEVVDGGASAFDKWVENDSRLVVVKRLGRDMKSDERRQSAYKKKETFPDLLTADLIPLADELRSVSYLETSFGEEEDYLMTVWLAGVDQASEAFASARKMLSEVATSSFAKKTKSRFAVISTETKLSSHILQCQIRCVSVPFFLVNGKIIPAPTIKGSEDLIAEIASQYSGPSIRKELRGEARLLHLMASKEIASACSSEEKDTHGRPLSVPYTTLMEAIETNNMTDLVRSSKLGDSDGSSSAPIEVFAMVDPTHEHAYIISALLSMMQSAFSADSASFNLLVAAEEDKLKKSIEQPTVFSKFLLQAKPEFDGISGKRIPPGLRFNLLPQGRVLTVALEPPRAWFVSSYSTNHDMDNVVLDLLPDGQQELHAEYELQNLIVEGSCVDEDERPPQGLKLILENDSGVSVDTLVMANLGYFQLKVPRPGNWRLRLAPGPSSEIFDLLTMEMFKDTVRSVYLADNEGYVSIPVESLSGAGGIVLHVGHKKGMEGKSVLNPEQGDSEKKKKENKNVIGRLRSKLGNFYPGKKKAKTADEAKPTGSSKSDTIHVFSVASGHLYERFLKIMITSVTKHASRPVKFWLLENYLSPSFKKVLPHFAKAHGAEVGMVTYRWPGWLRAQTEKQRIIWAYKILFLDVLFPLDVGRIIFVDSDQVIRGDLAELMDIDLRGAPYGYVPFCDSRKEVEGYRFWKTGFWKETLQGAKYRISALYVVDLIRFRETAAGDKLRLIYQSLSADPNSLSNLDQDLPNYASTPASPGGTVPIFDLPQEWLWCETWCDDESKKAAKAIDLCNNPDTKEPKLKSAKRIISEWVSYDDAATALTEKLYSSIHSQSSAELEGTLNSESIDDVKQEL